MGLKVAEKISASLEDYLESIYYLIQRQDIARSKDIAEAMGVSRASVTGALRALSDKELVHYRPYGFITLTEKGMQIARRVARRHEVLACFFEQILGAESSTAQAAACGAEHTLGPEITARLMAFVEFVTDAQLSRQDIARQFKDYWETSQGSPD